MAATKKASRKAAGIPMAPVRFRQESAEAHQVIHDRINNELDDLVSHLEDLARGVFMYAEVEGAEARVYRREPNLEALKYLIDRVMGRPVNRAESGSPGEFSSYEDFLKKRVEERKQLIVQEPKVLAPNTTTAVVEEQVRGGEVEGLDRESVLKRLLGS